MTPRKRSSKPSKPPAPAQEAPQETPGTSDRFAVYDLTLERFLPGTFTSRAGAEKSAQVAGRTGRTFEVREV